MSAPVKPSLSAGAGWWSRITHAYVSPVIDKATGTAGTGPLQHEDLGGLDAENQCEAVHASFSNALARAMEGAQGEVRSDGTATPDLSGVSMWSLVVHTAGVSTCVKLASLKALHAGLALVTPVLFQHLVMSLARDSGDADSAAPWGLSEPAWRWILVVAVSIVPMMQAMAFAGMRVYVVYGGVRAKAAMMAALYRKSLRLSAAGRAAANTGRIVTVMSNDASQAQVLINGVNQLWVSPIQISIAIYLVAQQVGSSVWAGILFMFAVSPVSALSFRYIKQLQRRVMRAVDARVKLVGDVLAGIRIAKMNAWEAAFQDKIGAARQTEVTMVRRLLEAVALLLYVIIGSLVTVMTVLVFVMFATSGGVLTTAKAFTTLQLLSVIRRPFLRVPIIMVSVLQARVAMARVKAVLSLDELTATEPRTPMDDSSAVEIKGATFRWPQVAVSAEAAAAQHGKTGSGKAEGKGKSKDKDKDRRHGQAARSSGGATGGPTTADKPAVGRTSGGDNGSADGGGDGTNKAPFELSNVTLTVRRGELVAVCGSVGGGKSTLVSGLVGDLPPASGTLAKRGSLAYVPQEPWVMNETLRENILFGSTMDRSRYKRVIEVCALGPDLEQLGSGNGDLTVIGERGINLSGGQKSRVSLCRAAYTDSDVVVLDDPLSAVDSHVAEHIFSRCITGEMASKTRIFVTNQMQLLPRCDRVVVIEGGRVVEDGTYDELMALNGACAKLVSHAGHTRGGGESKDASGDIIDRGDRASDGDGEDGDDRGGEDSSEDPDGTDALVEDSVERESSSEVASADLIALRMQMQYSGDSGSDSERDRDRARRGDEASRVRTRTLSHSHSRTRSGSAGAARARQLSVESHATVATIAGINPTSTAGARDASAGGSGEGKADSGKATERKGLMSEEDREVGRVGWPVYRFYFRAVGYKIVAVIVTAALASQGLTVSSSFWLSAWAGSSEDVPDGGALPTADLDWFLWGYGLLGLLSILTLMGQAVVFARGIVRAGTFIHDGLLARVLRAPVSWHDVTPQGRVLNRFSKDLVQVDLVIGRAMVGVVVAASTLAATSVGVAVATRGAFLVVVPPLGYIYNRMSWRARATGVEVQRLTSIARSPVFAHFSETLNGLSTIRAFGQQQRFIGINRSLLDSLHVPHCAEQMLQLWLNLRLQAMGSVIACGVAAFSVGASGFLSVELIAVALTFSLSLTDALESLVEATAQVESHMSSVERLRTYINNVPQEAAEETRADELLPKAWPEHGAVTFKDVTVRYRNNAPVLSRFSVDIPPHTRVGVVGRTGSGKSTLIAALFRIIETDDDGVGSITIDGHNTRNVGLRDLRTRLGAVQQSPTLFDGSLRYNLDPFDDYDDEALWTALRRVQMDKVVEAMPAGLLSDIQEGGSNLSVGQRQLICIARVLLRNPRLLVLDEASASLDLGTDALIQRTVRECFGDATLIVVAHRLETIEDSDLVIVLDGGRIAEMGPPAELLAKEGGVFRGMAEAAGRHRG